LDWYFVFRQDLNDSELEVGEAEPSGELGGNPISSEAF
jgi:hypothetical protein